MNPDRPWHRRAQRLDPEDLHQLLATEEYLDEWEYLADERPREPFEPGDYLDDGGAGGDGLMAFAEDYIDVATRLRMFREQHPNGSLQPVNPERPVEVVVIGDQTFLTYAAAAYRTPDDPRPGIGVAWEPFPGQTSFTRNSEAMNAESSAWGRAIVAALAADTKRGVASQEEVRNRQAERERPDPRAELRAQIATFAREHEMPLESVADTFQANYRVPIASGSVDMLAAFLAELREDAAQPAEVAP